MFTTEDILKRLRAGESMDDIAAEMTRIANAAEATYQAEEAEKKRAAEEKKLAEARKKDELATAIINAVLDYIRFLAPEMTYSEEETEELAEEIITLMDSLVPVLKVAQKVTTNPMPSLKIRPSEATLVAKTSTDEQILKNFLDAFIN